MVGGGEGVTVRHADLTRHPMIELPIYNRDGRQVDVMSIDESTLGGEVRFALLKQAYVVTHGNQRQGSSRTRNRGRVEGSTRKLYKQKGTGNARAGTVRTNLRKGGGVAFAKVRGREAFRTSLTKKMRRLANRNALLAKLVDGEVKCFDQLSFTAPRTKEFAAVLGAVGIDRTCLVALAKENLNGFRSARNLEGVNCSRIDQLNAFDLLNHRFLVTDRSSLESFLSGACFAGSTASAEDAR
ncbi:MAG: 50S ribosomal protein L4 [Phycisphaerae bacterium]|nr:50S ribosomal protein L4 [Phycisphaerae bacterium]